MDLLQAAGLAGAAFAAGAINAVAGGGSLVSFPALLAVGFPSKTANVTNTVALWPGYVGGSFGYRGELTTQRDRVRRLFGPSIAGAIAGSAILLSTPESAFEALVPFLIMFACGVMAFQDQIGGFVRAHSFVPADSAQMPAALYVAMFLLGIYGAYFGAGLGILALATLGIFLPDDIQRSNALKGLFSMIVNAVAVFIFAPFGPVVWWAVAVMSVAALAGGYFGVGVARKLGKRWLRVAVISYSLVVAVYLLIR